MLHISIYELCKILKNVCRDEKIKKDWLKFWKTFGFVDKNSKSKTLLNVLYYLKINKKLGNILYITQKIVKDG